MFQRVSKVKSVTATSVIFSATLQIGDCSYIDGKVICHGGSSEYGNNIITKKPI